LENAYTNLIRFDFVGYSSEKMQLDRGHAYDPNGIASFGGLVVAIGSVAHRLQQRAGDFLGQSTAVRIFPATGTYFPVGKLLITLELKACGLI
jgi:hypothetical protein